MAKRKTAISFGLVNIPVTLNPAIRHTDIGFNMLHKKCGERVKYQKYCPHCDTEVDLPDIIKGYEYEKEAYLTFDSSELNKIKSDKDNMIEIIVFVNLADIDPIYYEKSYVLDAIGNDKAFQLFSYVLESEQKIAIAKTVLGFKETIVALRFSGNSLIMTTLYYNDEIHLNSSKPEAALNDQEIKMASKLVEQMSGKFTPEKYTNEYQIKLEKAIEKKLSGKKITAVKSKSSPKITNLMEALEKSVKSNKK